MRCRRVWAGCAAAVLVLIAAVPAAATRVDGTDGDDVLVGTPDADLIVGRAGNDLVYARAGDDEVRGGPGDDELHLGPGHDRVWSTGGGSDVVYGARGADPITLRWGQDQAFTGPGDDQVWCSTPGSCTVRLGRGSDSAMAWGGVTADIGGGPGVDYLDYRSDDGANDNVEPCPTDRPCRPRVTLRGGRGADRIWLFMGWNRGPKATDGQFTVIAGPGNDEIYSDGYTRIWAGRGDDAIEVLGPGNAVDCGPGADTLRISQDGPIVTPTPTATGCETIIDSRW